MVGVTYTPGQRGKVVDLLHQAINLRDTIEAGTFSLCIEVAPRQESRSGSLQSGCGAIFRSAPQRTPHALRWVLQHVFDPRAKGGAVQLLSPILVQWLKLRVDSRFHRPLTQ